MGETMGRYPRSVWDMPEGMETPDGRLPCVFGNQLSEGLALTTRAQWGPWGFQNVSLSHQEGDCRACRNAFKEMADAFSFGRDFYIDLGFAVLRGTPDGESFFVDRNEW